jgi:predicted CoA-substrate-specific enzyme activase
VICAGVDAGSRTIKVVLLETGGEAGRQSAPRVIGSAIVDQGVRPDRLAADLLRELLSRHKIPRRRVSGLVGTGYARHAVREADRTVTEITCQARGVRQLLPAARTIVEIGGQDSKIIHLDEAGGVVDFAMNDRCAAGSGRFLEVVATRLEVGLEELGRLAAKSRAPAAINSTCVVFAETEIVGLLAAGARPRDIAAGVQAAICTRVCALSPGRMAEPVAFAGGVALIPHMAETLGRALGRRLAVAPDPQFTGALGAALLAAEQKQGRTAVRPCQGDLFSHDLRMRH